MKLSVFFVIYDLISCLERQQLHQKQILVIEINDQSKNFFSFFIQEVYS